MHTFRWLPTTPYFICRKNHSQLNLFSPSINAKANGSIWLFVSTPIAVRIYPLYFAVKKVSSTQSNGRQCRKDSMHVPKLKKARSNVVTSFASGSLSLNAVYVTGLFCFITSSTRGRLQYEASKVPNLISMASCFARQAFKWLILYLNCLCIAPTMYEHSKSLFSIISLNI